MHPSQPTDMVIDQNMNQVHCPLGNISNQDNKRNELKANLVHSDRIPRDLSAMSHRLDVHTSNSGHDVKLNYLCVKTPEGDNKSDAKTFTSLKESDPKHENKDANTITSDEHSEEDDDTVHCETEIKEIEESTNPETVQKRVCLVKLYAWLKEEISKTAARAIANHLFQHQGTLLSRADHEAINHSKWRRETVELLLKKVLMGPDDINEAFIKALKAEEEGHIIEKLEHTQVSEDEIKLFTQLEQSSLHRCVRPDSEKARFTISTSDNETVLFYLNNKNIIDSVNDQFLSKFYFSIREHTNICVCSMDSEGRIRTLINTMKLCANKIFAEFCDILNAIEMGHVISKLERRNEGLSECKQRKKRKSSSSNQGCVNDEVPSSSSAKRQCVDPSIEYRLVSSMQRSASNLRLHSLEQFGFDVENVNKGSIVIQLSPQTPDSWKRLEENCRSGKIKDFIPKVYDNADIYDMLKEGEYKLQFTIYTLPSPPDTKVEKKVMFHLETGSTSKKDDLSSVPKPSPIENQVEEQMDLLCEELEISKDLITLLKKEKLVEENIEEEINKQGSRTKKIKFLMKKIAAHGNTGYDVLKEYIKENNEDLYQELLNREEVRLISDTKLDQAAKVTKKSKPTNGTSKGVNRKEVFFSGTVILKVTKPVVETDSESKVKSGKPRLDISCTEIINPVCHFLSDDRNTDTPKTGEITMVLEDSWIPVGTEEPAKRDILVGKRKTREKKQDTADQVPLKRYHSTEEHTSEEETSQDLASDLKENEACSNNSKEYKVKKSDLGEDAVKS